MNARTSDFFEDLVDSAHADSWNFEAIKRRSETGGDSVWWDLLWIPGTLKFIPDEVLWLNDRLFRTINPQHAAVLPK